MCFVKHLTCGTQEAVLLFLSSLADINDAEEPLVIGREDVPLESVLDGCHGGCCLTQHNMSATHRGSGSHRRQQSQATHFYLYTDL